MESETSHTLDAIQETPAPTETVPTGSTPTPTPAAPKTSRFHTPAMVIAASVALILIAAFVFRSVATKTAPEPTVNLVSTLEHIILTSELSSHTAVYNGITQVMNEKKPENVDYYVSYEARVKAGITLADVRITQVPETKIIQIHIPDVHITSKDVDITTLDFLFYNDKANTVAVSQEAYKACQADVAEEVKQQKAILDCARTSAENILRALTVPITQQIDSDYQIDFVWGDIK